MKRFPYIILLVLLLSSFSYSQEVVDSIAIIINNEIILESEIEMGIQMALMEEGPQWRSVESMELLRKNIINNYIAQRILIAKANEESLTVEPRIVDRELERRITSLSNQVGGQDRLVEYYGKPIRQIRRDMRRGVRDALLVDILKQQKTSGIHVRRQEVVDFFNTFKDSLPIVPEFVELSHILITIKPSEEAKNRAMLEIEEIHQLLQDGANFDSLARVRSEDASAPMGGYLGYTSRGDLLPVYEETAYALEIGSISKPIQTHFGFHVVKLIDRQGERITTRHILIKLSPNENDKINALQFSNQLYERIQSGEPFDELARQYSDDAETKQIGGQIGKIDLDDLQPEYKDAITGLSIGNVSHPIETDFGFHLIKLNKREASRTIDIKKDWQIIEQYALMHKRERVFFEWVEELKKENFIWPEYN